MLGVEDLIIYLSQKNIETVPKFYRVTKLVMLKLSATQTSAKCHSLKKSYHVEDTSMGLRPQQIIHTAWKASKY